MNFEWLNQQKRQAECQLFAAKLNEYVDGDLDRDLAWRIQNHIAVCSSCEEQVASLRSLVRVLNNAPRQEVSSEFASILEARIAGLPKKVPAEAPITQDHAHWLTRINVPMRLTGSFAAAAVFLFGVVFLTKGPSNPPTPTIPPVQIHSANISDLVDQHRAQSAGDPLSDASAQLLASSVDTIKVDPTKNHHLSDDDAAMMLGGGM